MSIVYSDNIAPEEERRLSQHLGGVHAILIPPGSRSLDDLAVFHRLAHKLDQSDLEGDSYPFGQADHDALLIDRDEMLAEVRAIRQGLA